MTAQQHACLLRDEWLTTMATASLAPAADANSGGGAAAGAFSEGGASLEHQQPEGAQQPQSWETLTSPLMTAAELEPLTVCASAPADELRAVLDTFGVAVVTNVLDASECARMEGLWRQDLLHAVDAQATHSPHTKRTLAAIQESGVRAWPHAWSPAVGKHGVASQRGLPHGSFAWACRLHPGVRRIFAEVFGVEDGAQMSTGLDCTFFSAADSAAAETNSQWLHVDQNHHRGRTELCFQGVLYIWPSSSTADSTTVVWPGSHREVYARLMEDDTAKQGKGNGQQLNHLADGGVRAELLQMASCCARRVPCPAGSLLLWDSRVVHQGWRGGPRLAQPVCWEPRDSGDEAGAHRRKLWMCATGTPSTHSANEGRVHGMSRGRAQPEAESEGAPAMRSMLVPASVDPGRLEQWHQHIDHMLPLGSKKKLKKLIADTFKAAEQSAIQGLLREEVASAL